MLYAILNLLNIFKTELYKKHIEKRMVKTKPPSILNKHILYPFWSLFLQNGGASDQIFNCKLPLATSKNVSKFHDMWFLSTKVITKKKKINNEITKTTRSCNINNNDSAT